MTYRIIYDAVMRKAETTPPNDYIGNVEMAAGMGIVLSRTKKELEFQNISTPQEMKDEFLSAINESEKDNLDELCGIIMEKIIKYQVKEMVNETMNDLKNLVTSYDKIMAGEEIYTED